MIQASFAQGCLMANGITGKDVGDLCRNLIAAGTPDGPMDIYRGEMKCLIVKSIHKQAQFTIHNEPVLKYARYRDRWDEQEEDAA